jgi:hypothetical protein
LIMKASVGDRLVVESAVVGRRRREAVILALRHEDGTPPYEVQWSDTGQVCLVFPGPDTHVASGR